MSLKTCFTAFGEKNVAEMWKYHQVAGRFQMEKKTNGQNKF